MSGEKAITNEDQVKTEENIKKCTLGLIEKFESPVKGVDVSLEVINNRQTVITDKLIGENEKFQKVSEEYKISDMIQKTKQYQQKLSGLQKEMVTLSERSANMKTRAMRLQEAKQKEALRREQKRQHAAEREEALVARPASK